MSLIPGFGNSEVPYSSLVEKKKRQVTQRSIRLVCINGHKIYMEYKK